MKYVPYAGRRPGMSASLGKVRKWRSWQVCPLPYDNGMLLMYKISGDRTRVWSCCRNGLGSTGCTSGPHVFLEKKAEDLHSRVAFILTSSITKPEGSNPLDIVALDCEMVYTTAGMALARLTIVNADGQAVLDEYIRPNGMVVDLVTRWSGITETLLEDKARLSLDQLRTRKLGKYVNENTCPAILTSRITCF